jgi:putative transposase
LPHRRPDWINFDDCYLLGVCSRPRAFDQLANDRVAPALKETLAFLEARSAWRLHALVVMPDHLHWLALVPPSTDLRHTVTHWKRYVARLHGVVWQRDFFEHRLRASERGREKLEYLRQNPVRAGLVKTPCDWPYFWSWPSPHVR